MHRVRSRRCPSVVAAATGLAAAVAAAAFPFGRATARPPVQEQQARQQPSALFLARLPGLRVEHLYYRRADLQEGVQGTDYIEDLDLRGATPGSSIEARHAFRWHPAEYIDSFTVSPDGHWAAVLVKSAGYLPNTDVTNIHLADLQSGQSRPLTTDWAGYGMPAWSSDGRTLAYESQEGVTEGLIPALPDRPRKLPPWTVYVQAVPEGRRRRLFRQTPSADGLDSYIGLTWVPGRRTLIYASVRPRGLFLLSADRHPPVRLSRRVPFCVDLRSRRGCRLDQASHTVRVFSLPADPAALERLATWRSPPVVGTLRLPTETYGLLFSPDGQRVLAVVQRYRTDPEGQYLAVVDLPSRTVRAFGRREPTGEVRWSRDGRYLLWEQRTPRDAGNLSELVAVRANAAPVQPLASVDWWRESGVQATVLVRLTTEWANQFRWVEGK